MIPLVSGNLSVEYLMSSRAGGPRPAPGAHRDELVALAQLGFGAVEDYVAWGVVEAREGVFDWSFHQENLAQCKSLGLRYVVYPWLHVVPAWHLSGGRFTGFRCLEHDRECGWPSLFDPAFFALARRFYEELARALGDGVDAVCVALPADYGEAGYPTGFGEWVSRLEAPRDHVHPGFWCGDVHARAAFARFVLARHGSLDAVNRAWQTRFEDPAALAPRLADGRTSLAWRRDFADFYVGALAEGVERQLAEARAVFPGKQLWIKVGHGGEPLVYGIDPTRLVEAAARHGAGIRTTQATLPTLHQKRLASPCRWWAVPFATEPPVDVGRETVVERLFHDATGGAVEYFEYAEHMVGARDLIARYGGLLTGAASECDVGVLFPGVDHRLHFDQGLPPVLFDLAETLRDRCDFELYDERAIHAGALTRLEVLALLEGAHLDRATQEEVVGFVARGGRLVVSPEFAADADGPLCELLARAPDAGACVDLVGVPTESMFLPLGVRGDSLRVSGDWHLREDAAQFRGQPPVGESSRWTGRRGATHFPVRAGRRYLLEIDAWVHPRTVHLRHAVEVDGRVVGALARPGLQRFAAWVSVATARGAGVAEVAIASETFRAIDVGAGDDVRELGVAVIWQRMTEEGSPEAGLRGAEPPRLEGRVRLADLTARGTLAHGAGAVVRSRRRPLVAFLALLEDEIARHSRVVRAAFGSTFAGGAEAAFGSVLDGVRATVFPRRILLWNRNAEDRTIGGIVAVPAGGLAAVERGDQAGGLVRGRVAS
ncbi:MAG TPA: hypothetical protein VFG37_12690 [Planctomycetota bacterium]|nr:hypothetical protein [Planctomycetota bacterium]